MPTIADEIIIRSIQKSATPEELEILNQWLKEDKKNAACYFQLEEVWSSKDRLPDEYIQKSWQMLARQINRHPATKPLPQQTAKRRKISWVGYVAAAFAGVLIASTLWLTFDKKSLDFTEPLIQHTVYNKTGVQSITLPDQSQVWLNEHSRIDYPEEFSKEKRLVSLEGKAYFDIRKDLEKPFIVQIDEVAIEVVGTEFFVESAPEKESLITLISGKVKLNFKERDGSTTVTTFLSPGEQAHIDGTSGSVTVEHVDTDYFVAWKDGIYRFDEERLEKITAMLARHYGLEIHVAPSLKNKHFTGRVVPGESVEDVLRSIGKSYPVRYRINGNRVDISE